MSIASQEMGRRSRGTPPPGRRRALAVLAIVAVLLAAGMAADLLAAPAPPAPTEPLPQPPASAGTWYCPSVAGEGERAFLTVAAVGDEPSRVVVDRYAKGRAVADKPRTVAPGGVVSVPLTEADARAPSAVRWTGGPAAVQWRVDGDRTAAAPCEAGPAERWYIPGFNSNLGNTPNLHLFNPFTADAVVRMVFATSDGGVSRVLTDNILVGAGKTSTINLRKFMPEEPDLGVAVEVLSGRVVAQGEQTIDPPGKASGATGRLLLSAAREPSDTWSFAYAADGERTESWLSVMNPNDSEAAVELRVSAPSQSASSFVGEISIPAGGISRVELAGVSKSDEFGVTVNVVNGQPVVVAEQTALSAAGRIAVHGTLGAPAADDVWALVGGGSRRRAGQVSLYNPGADPVTVRVQGKGAPESWRAIELAPNVRKHIYLGETGTPAWSLPVIASGDGPFVAELRSRATAGSSLRLWANIGVPDAVWVGPTTRPVVARDPSLSTHAGVAPQETEDVLDADAEEPAAEPVPAETTAPEPRKKKKGG